GRGRPGVGRRGPHRLRTGPALRARRGRVSARRTRTAARMSPIRPGADRRHTVAGIVLAAGSSSRMGRPKMLLPLGGVTLLARVAQALLDGGLARVIVVLGHEADMVRRQAGLPQDERLE